MVLYGAISHMKIKKIYRILFMLAFALAGPLGVLFGETVLAEFHLQASAFVAGIFIHIATVILFESTDSHKFKAQKVLTVLFGFVIAYLTIQGSHH